MLSQEDALAFAKVCQFGIGSALKLEGWSEIGFVDSAADASPHAADLCRLARVTYERGEFELPLELEPAYLRREQAWKKLDQQRA